MTVEAYLKRLGESDRKAEAMEEAIIDKGIKAWFDSMSFEEIKTMLYARLDMALVEDLDADELAELDCKYKNCTYVIETKKELVGFDDVYDILKNPEIVEKLNGLLEEYAVKHRYDEDVPF